jgi:hypothetical protein
MLDEVKGLIVFFYTLYFEICAPLPAYRRLP